MNPLNEAQKTQIQSFSQEQKDFYNKNRAAGIDAQTALRLSVQLNTEKNKATPTGDGLIFGQKSLGSSIVEGVKEAATGGVRDIGENIDQYGVVEGLVRSPLSLVAGVGRGVGQIFGGIAETADDITGEVVSDALMPLAERAIQSNTGQAVIQGLNRFDDATHGIAGDILDVTNLAGIGALKSAPAQALKDAIISKVGTTARAAAKSTVSGGAKVVKNLSEYIKPLATKVDDVAQASGGTVIDDVFTAAQSRGFNPQQARVFSDLGALEKPVAKQMIDLAEGVAEGTVAKTKLPIDFVGDTVKTRIKDVSNLASQFGKNVEEAATALKGATIDTQPLNQSILELAQNFGIRKKKSGWDFGGSDFALTAKVQKDLSKALDYAISPKADAYAVHRIKKTLDTLINPVKQGEGLEGSAKRLIQDLRKTTDDFLDSNFDAYRAANEKFASVRNVLDMAEDVLGNATSSRLGQKVRSLFSNNMGRSEAQSVFDALDDVARVNGLGNSINLRALGQFAEQLDELFGTQAVTGLRGQTEAAIKGVQSVVEGLRDPIKGVGNIAGTVVETISKQRPQDRIDFIKQLLSQ